MKYLPCLSVFTETRKVVCYACPYSLANLPPPTESKGEICVHNLIWLLPHPPIRINITYAKKFSLCLFFLLFVNSDLQNTIQPFLFLRYIVRCITFVLFCAWPSPAADAGWPTQAGLWPQTGVPNSTPRPRFFWSYPSPSWLGTTCIAFLSSRWTDDQNLSIEFHSWLKWVTDHCHYTDQEQSFQNLLGSLDWLLVIFFFLIYFINL